MLYKLQVQDNITINLGLVQLIGVTNFLPIIAKLNENFVGCT
jgi:hypothetical protein